MAIAFKGSIFLNNGASPPLPNTGQAANLTFRESPYATPGNVLTNIAFAEVGSTGHYTYTGFDTGTTGFYKNVKLYLSGTEQTSFGVQDIGSGAEEFLSKFDTASQAMTGAIAMGANKITGLAAGTATGDAVRFDEAILTTGTQTKAGQLIFSSTGSIVPSISAPTTTGYPTATGHLTSKHYVDTIFAGVIGVVQSTFLNKVIPLRTTEDAYSHTTMELANAYLAALVSGNTKRGVMLLEPLGASGNTINADDGTSAWISDRVDIVGMNRPVINRRAPNSSLTVEAKIIGCHIVDGAAGTPVVAARSYTNFTFENCTFDIPDDTDLTFTTCIFKGINKVKSDGGATVTLTNCTGDAFWYNDTVNTITITGTQPADVKAVLVANFEY
jgi:hypothetical protein